MIKSKRILAMLLSIIICISLCPTVFAAENNVPVIKISNVSAMPGDTVTISIDISNNPGIMAMAFCITYDSDSLQYSTYQKGYLTNYTVKDHSDKGHVSFVNVENSDKSDNGTLLSVVFAVKDNATPGKHTITLANSNRDKYGNKLHNSFSNSKQKFIVPTVTAGSVTVAETCDNAGHKYGDWTVVRKESCTATGLKSRTCTRCQNVEEDVIPITHDFEAEWTVDKVATPEEDGIMSRHCTKCDAVTDKITFSYEEIGGDDTDDTSSDESSSDTSDDNSSGTDSSEENSSDNDTSSDDSSSGEDTSANESNSENTSSDSQTNSSQTNSTPIKKPVINNTEGAKNPLSEVEKLEDYIQNIKPSLEKDNVSSEDASGENTSSEDVSSETDTDSSDLTTTTPADSDTTITPDEENSSFFSTPTGIILTIVCILISVGIIALGVILIIRNKKSQED